MNDCFAISNYYICAPLILNAGFPHDDRCNLFIVHNKEFLQFVKPIRLSFVHVGIFWEMGLLSSKNLLPTPASGGSSCNSCGRAGGYLNFSKILSPFHETIFMVISLVHA